MSGPRKYLPNKKVIFITSTVEEDIVFPPNELINFLLLSALARAQYYHPVKICHFVFEGTHFHMILIVENPDDIPDFMERFKTESSHMVNRLLGRKKKTIWCEGYDSPLVGTVSKAIKEIVYTYTNPAKDGLESTISKYPGLSSYRVFKGGRKVRAIPYVKRSDIFQLPDRVLGDRDYKRYVKVYKRLSKSKHTFTVEPDAWMEAFGISEAKEREEINNIIFSEIEKKEEHYRKLREKEGKGVIGAERLKQVPVGTPYTPERKGKRSYVLCDDIDLRKRILAAIKELIAEADEVLQAWRQGDFTKKYPPGLFPPGMPKVMNHYGPVVETF